MVFAKLRDLASLVGLKAWISSIAPIIYNDHLIFYLISRVFSATLGALTVIPLYLWVKKLVTKNAGLLASAFLSLAPFHVRHSHYALVDVPMLFFLSWSLFFSTFSPILAGLFLGFSASTKYNGVLGGLFIASYYLLRHTKPLRQRAIDVIKLGIFTVIGFFIGTPYALLDYKTFLRTDGPQGALWQFTNVGKVPFLEQLVQFFSTMGIKFPYNIGYGAMLLLGIGLCILLYQVVRKKPIDKLVALTAVTFLALTFYISGLAKNRAQYYMIVYPYFFLTASWTFSLLLNRLKNNGYKVIIICVVLLPSLVLSVSNIADLKNKTSNTIYGGDIEEDVKINP